MHSLHLNFCWQCCSVDCKSINISTAKSFSHHLEYSRIFHVWNLTHKMLQWPSQELEPRAFFSWLQLHRSWGITNRPSCIKWGNELKVYEEWEGEGGERAFKRKMGISVYLMPIHVYVWQELSQYCKVVIL